MAGACERFGGASAVAVSADFEGETGSEGGLWKSFREAPGEARLASCRGAGAIFEKEKKEAKATNVFHDDERFKANVSVSLRRGAHFRRLIDGLEPDSCQKHWNCK